MKIDIGQYYNRPRRVPVRNGQEYIFTPRMPYRGSQVPHTTFFATVLLLMFILLSIYLICSSLNVVSVDKCDEVVGIQNSYTGKVDTVCEIVIK